jgi:hypothetical protein
MYQRVAATFMIVATPCGASVLDIPAPPVPDPAKSRVSVVIAIVTVAPDPATNTMVVPISSGTDEFAGMVTVLLEVE